MGGVCAFQCITLSKPRGEQGKPELLEQVPELGHGRVCSSALCCSQRGSFLALPLKQQLHRPCPGASCFSRQHTLRPLHSASARTARESPKPVFLRATWTLRVRQPSYGAWELVTWGQAQEQRRT